MNAPFDWRDEAFTRQQSQHLAHTQPLVGMDYSAPWMTGKQWLVCAAAIVAFVVWVFCS